MSNQHVRYASLGIISSLLTLQLRQHGTCHLRLFHSVKPNETSLQETEKLRNFSQNTTLPETTQPAYTDNNIQLLIVAFNPALGFSTVEDGDNKQR